MRRGALRALAATLTAAVASVAVIAPAGSQDDDGGPVGLREGRWIGEIVLVLEMRGTVDGAQGTYSGGLDGDAVAEVVDGTIDDGDWALNGDATIEFVGSTSGTITQTYSGLGVVSGTPRELALAGEITTTGSVASQGVVLDVPPQVSAFEVFQIPVTSVDCNQIEADLQVPVEALAGQGGWSQVEADGIVQLTWAGEEDDQDDPLVEQALDQLESLREAQDAWAAGLAGGVVDFGGGSALIAQARLVTQLLSQIDECRYDADLADGRYAQAFVSRMASALLSALRSGVLGTGAALQSAALLQTQLSAAGALPTFIAVEIGEQANAIMDAAMAADGASCNPCYGGGRPPADVVQAALAAHMMNQPLFVDGIAYTPGRIIGAVEAR